MNSGDNNDDVDDDKFGEKNERFLVPLSLGVMVMGVDVVVG